MPLAIVRRKERLKKRIQCEFLSSVFVVFLQREKRRKKENQGIYQRAPHMRTSSCFVHPKRNESETQEKVTDTKKQKERDNERPRENCSSLSINSKCTQ